MALQPDYTTGTITVAAGGTTVTGTGTAWKSADIRAGDTIIAKGLTVVVTEDPTSETSLKIEPWPGTALTNVAYRIRFQPDASRLTATARDLLIALANGNLAAIADLASAADTVPYFTGGGTAALKSLSTFARLDVTTQQAFQGEVKVKVGSWPDPVIGGQWAGTVYHAENGPDANGLLVANNWASTTSTVFEVGRVNATNGAFTSYFKILGNGVGTYSGASLNITGTLTIAGKEIWTKGNLEPSALSGFRNKIINGDFDVWQRGTSGFGKIGYNADRWLMASSSSDSVAISRQSHTLGQGAVPGNPKYFLRAVITAGVGGLNDFRQRIEGASTLAGKKVTLTYYVRGNVASTVVQRRITQFFGTGGSPSAPVSTALPNLNVGTSWQKVQDVVTLPSVAGKTLGTNSDDYLDVVLSLPTGQTVNIDISHVSLVEGDATKEADPFSPRAIQQEIALCQRYFIKEDYSASGGPYGAQANNSAITRKWMMPIAMRVSPAVTVAADNGTVVAETIGDNIIQFSSNVGDTTSLSRLLTWSADAEI